MRDRIVCLCDSIYTVTELRIKSQGIHFRFPVSPSSVVRVSNILQNNALKIAWETPPRANSSVPLHLLRKYKLIMFSFYPEHLFFHSVLTTHDRSAICLEAYSAVILGVFS